MRNVDHKNMGKQHKAICKIRPCCSSERVDRAVDNIVTSRFLVHWRGRKIRTGLVGGGIINGEPSLTPVGMMCLDHWMIEHPTQKVVFVEFKSGMTGNIDRMRGRLIEWLDRMEQYGDNAVMLLVAKNSTMYDKLCALIGGINRDSDLQDFPFKGITEQEFEAILASRLSPTP